MKNKCYEEITHQNCPEKLYKYVFYLKKDEIRKNLSLEAM
jgi:hypothetical protein